MPVILLQIDARDNATAGIGRVSASLSGLDRTMGSLAGASDRVQAAMRNQETAYLRLDAAQIRVASNTVREQMAQERAATAAGNYQRALSALASATDTSGRAQGLADQAYTRMISTQDRAAVQAGNLARAYQQLALAQDGVTRAGGRMNAALRGPLPGPGAAASGGGDGHGGGMGQIALYSIGYQLVGSVEQAIRSGFQNSVELQKTLYATQATTGITAGTRNTIEQNAIATAQSGQSIYSPTQLAGAAYNVASVGITDPAAIKRITDLSMQSATASGATDPASFSAAITGSLQSYGFTSPHAAAAHAQEMSDQAMMAVNLGRMNPQDMPSAVGTFGTAAAHAGLSPSDAFGLFAQNTRLSRNAQQSSQDTFAFVNTVTDPNQVQRRYAAQLGVSDYFGPQAFKHRTLSQWETGINAATQGPNQQLFIQKLMGQVNSANLEMGFLGPHGSSMSTSLDILRQQQGANAGKGATKTAYDAYMAGPAGQYEAAQVQFNTAVQQFASAMTPFMTGALAMAASALTVKDPKGAVDVAGYLLNHPLATIDQAKDAVARQEQHLPPNPADNPDPWTAIKRAAAQTLGDLGIPVGWGNPATPASAPAPRPTIPADTGQSGPASPARSGRWVNGIYIPGHVLPPPAPPPENLFGGRNAGAATYAVMHADAPQSAADAARGQRQRGAFDMANATTRGQHIDVSSAQDRLTLALAGFGDVTKALGIYEQAVKNDATISPVKRRLMDLAAESSVGASRGKAGPAVAPFTQQNAGLGGLEAGFGGTAVRFGGGKDSQAAEIRKLTEELAKANAENRGLLQQIATNTGVRAQAARENPLAPVGGIKSHRGR